MKTYSFALVGVLLASHTTGAQGQAFFQIIFGIINGTISLVAGSLFAVASTMCLAPGFNWLFCFDCDTRSDCDSNREVCVAGLFNDHRCRCASGWNSVNDGLWGEGRCLACNPTADPCGDHGTCTEQEESSDDDPVVSFRCACEPGYQGYTCQDDIDECLRGPWTQEKWRDEECYGYGVCVDLVNEYRCDCESGRVGLDCEYSRDEIQGNDIYYQGELFDAGDMFGSCLVSEPCLAAGSPGPTGKGKVTVMGGQFSSWLWGVPSFLEASDGKDGDEFGFSCTGMLWWIDQPSNVIFLAVGAPKHDATNVTNGQSLTGAVYVYNSTEQAIYEDTTTEGDSVDTAGFGHSVAFFRERHLLFVGAPLSNDEDFEKSGSVYIFRLNKATGVWTQEKVLTSNRAGNEHLFGWSLSTGGYIDSDDYFVAIGSPGSDDGRGSLFLFKFAGHTDVLLEEFELHAENSKPGDSFGWSHAFPGWWHDATFLVGAPNAFDKKGAVYAFDHQDMAQSQVLSLSDGEKDDQFGWSISAAGGEVAVVGAVGRRAAYIYNWDHDVEGVWKENQALTPGDAIDEDKFGYSVSIIHTIGWNTRPTAIGLVEIGAPLKENGGGSRGSVYEFAHFDMMI